jgi:site-specific recombinase XerD
VGHNGGADQCYTCNPRKPLSYSACRLIIKKYGLAAGIDDKLVHLHALRHRGAHNRKEDMEDSGGVADLLALRDKLGHKSVGTTEIYLYNSDQRVKDRYLRTAEENHARELPVLEEVPA